MSLEFRCENCGSMLSVTDGKPGSVACSHCGKNVDIPAVLPPAIVPPAVAVPTASQAAPVQAAPVHSQHHAHTEEAAGAFAVIMPWVISLFLHLGVGMIAYFGFTLAMANKPAPDDKTIPEVSPIVDVDTLRYGGGSGGLGGSKTVSVKILDNKEYTKKNSPSDDSGKTTAPLPVTVTGGEGTSAEKPGGDLKKGDGAGNGPQTGFFGPGGNAYHVVYVIDRSGSMRDTFDLLRAEMCKSLGDLLSVQDFHIIFFSSGPPTENEPLKLVPAIDEYKINAAEFLRGVTTINQTDPLPALKRAFEVLRNTDSKKKGKMLFLLTDGEFPDNAKVLKLIAEENVNKDVHIFTFLYGHKSPTAVKVMEQIAAESGGKFKQIDPNE